MGGIGMSKDVSYKNRDRFLELRLAIASLRKMKGLSQDALAAKAGISRSHLSAIEAPQHHPRLFCGSAVQSGRCLGDPPRRTAGL